MMNVITTAAIFALLTRGKLGILLYDMNYYLQEELMERLYILKSLSFNACEVRLTVYVMELFL